MESDKDASTQLDRLLVFFTIQSTEELQGEPVLPESLAQSKTKQSLDETRRLFNLHGFRCSLVTSPRPGLSIYMDSCTLPVTEKKDRDSDQDFQKSPSFMILPVAHVLGSGKEFLLAMLGVHPQQENLERLFKRYIQSLHTFRLFFTTVQLSSDILITPNDHERTAELDCLLKSYMQRVEGLVCETPDAVDFTAEANAFISLLSKDDTRFRPDQLQKEYLRIQHLNSTFSSMLIQLYINFHDCVIHDVVHTPSLGCPRFERITIVLHDPLDLSQQSPFVFLPAFHILLTNGFDTFVDNAVESFWSHVLKLGYTVMPAMQQTMSLSLAKYFASGLSYDPFLPISLKAHFHPAHPLSYHLWGGAGSGKSSLVRIIPLALQATLQEFYNAELIVRFVKQNLNKPSSELDLEFTKRSNNNDMSIMSIIEGRRMTLAHSTPCLVVVHMEEMPDMGSGDPNQIQVCRLISQRFSGRTSSCADNTAPHGPQNACQRSVVNDAAFVVFLTSNYKLNDDGKMALKQLDMFSNLVEIETKALDGKERESFAKFYLRQSILDQMAQKRRIPNIRLELVFGRGDVRPLVRNLRMLAFYTSTLLRSNFDNVKSVIIQQQGEYCLIQVGHTSIELITGFMGIVFPRVPQMFDARTLEVRHRLDQTLQREEIMHIVEAFFAKALQPVVIVSNKGDVIAALIQAIAKCRNVSCIPSLDVSRCKMTRSLYDPSGSYNLRDDIQKKSSGSYCVIELICPNEDAQLGIREMIEDSPSLASFSNCNSGMKKSGLLFGILVIGKISAQIRSRATLLL